ncbi:MAG: hypothetical protein JXB48_06965 [Candidatus Latescibacteria bacterium]|nr:hypothetical protein [Candidatus Latescibacterota bacterium]
MVEQTALQGNNAFAFLCRTFENIEPGRAFRVRITDRSAEKKQTEIRAKITIAGFSEEVRKKQKNLGKITEKRGSVMLYGDDHPDYCITLENGGKVKVFQLNEAKVTITGFGDSIISISSGNWENESAIGVYLKNVYTGTEAQKYLTHVLMKTVNTGTYKARLGKWVSKKSYDRSLKKYQSDLMAIGEYVKSVENDLLRTTHIGADISNIDFIAGKPSQNVDHTLKAKYTYDTTTVKFHSMVIEADTTGKEIGTQKSQSSYVYLIGTSFNSHVNLVIIRHNKNT